MLPHPYRDQVSNLLDRAEAIHDWTGRLSRGDTPLEALRTIDRVIRETEAALRIARAVRRTCELADVDDHGGIA